MSDKRRPDLARPYVALPTPESEDDFFATASSMVRLTSLSLVAPSLTKVVFGSAVVRRHVCTQQSTGMALARRRLGVRLQRPT